MAKVGVPKEIKDNEYRVALTLAGTSALVADGHTVYVQTGAGVGSGIKDEDYKKAGAKYFMSMGVHVDNFDLWRSKHTRWNAVNFGIKKDVVGLFRQLRPFGPRGAAGGGQRSCVRR